MQQENEKIILYYGSVRTAYGIMNYHVCNINGKGYET